MRRIILYGELAKRFGKEHHFSVRSASEAFQAMCVNFPGFKEFMSSAHKYGIGFQVFVGGGSLQAASDACLPSGDRDIIRVCPAVFGSGAVTRIIVGAVLIVAGAIVTGASGGGGSPVGGYMITAGIGLVLGGVVQLLSPPPKTPGSGNSDLGGQSYIFSGPENVSQQGGSVPVGYGRMMVGSTVISAGIEDQDQ